MKIAKMIPMNYTVVYVEDGGKYSAYRRNSEGEWKDAISDRNISEERSERLESLFQEESKKS